MKEKIEQLCDQIKDLLKKKRQGIHHRNNTRRDILIAIRIESDKLVFCVETTFTDDEQTACENVEEVSIGSLVDSYGDEVVVRALEAYVGILSDEIK